MERLSHRRYRAFKHKLKNIVIPVLAYGGVAGIFVGFVVSLFNLAANKISEYSSQIYAYVRDNPLFIPLLFAGLIALALLMALLHKYIPEVRGSGIPQTEGVLRGLLTFKWLRILIGTVAGSFIAFFAGLSVGSEGPSVQLGATTAQGTTELLRSRLAWRRYVMTGGASAGLAVAFNAPLTGIIFALEEAHRRFTPMILLTASSSVIFGTITYRSLSSLWGGGGYLFDMGQLYQIPINYYWTLLIVGVISGLVALFFNFSLIRSQRVLDKCVKKYPYWLRLIVIFVLTGVTGLVIHDVNGGGHELIMKIANLDFTWQMLLLLLVVKFVMIVLNYDAGVTGGLFIPMLSIGALVGGLCGKLFVMWGLDANCYKTIVCIAMTTFFGASVRAPITAIVLVIELTGYMTGFLSAAISIFSAYLVAELLGSRPIYDGMLERQLKIQSVGGEKKRVQIEVEVEFGAFLIDKCVQDVLWPANCLVLNLVRGEEEIVPDGETRIQEGDKLVIQAETYNSEETYNYIKGLIHR